LSDASSPFVTVVMPTRNEADAVGECLAAVLSQDYPHDLLEVIVADGRSTDRTREIVETFQARDPRVRLCDNSGRIVSTGLNEAIRAARGGVLVRIDAHTRYAPDYVARCVEVLEQTGADNVGGPWVARGRGYIGRAIAAVFRSSFAVGPARSHDPAYEGPVDSVYLGCWRRDVFDRVGLFDEELVRNQDDEWNLRLQRAGGLVWQSPRIRSEYSPRESLSALFRQYLQYGFWKVAVIRKHRLPASWRHLVPGAFVLILTLLLFAIPFRSEAFPAAATIAATYAMAVLVASLVEASRAGWKLLPALPLIFPAFHFGYGIGFLCGLLSRRPPSREGLFGSLTRAEGTSLRAKDPRGTAPSGAGGPV
jgi:succinoglycan biosynthesis protein ExoA